MGTFYVDPYAVVWWLSYTRRLAINPIVLNRALGVRQSVYRALHPGDPAPQEQPDVGWAVVGQQRVVVWNGGPSDTP